ncbi:MAG: transketolase [Christensenellaceae bacterium]|nr:transketolase [Christensenellaceae bacterium]
MTKKELELKATQIRKKTLELIYKSKMGHVGGDMSIADILTVLYYKVMKLDPNNPKWEGRDYYVQSKGHAVETLLTILSDKGFFTDEELSTFGSFGSKYIGHPTNVVNGIEVNTGALGHGLSIAVGMAKGLKMDNKLNHVYCLMGDGEVAEGSIWEAAMAASHYKLDNLTAILDRNILQISGKTEEVMSLEPLKDKWEAFGFEFIEIDGHDIGEIEKALLYRKDGKPILVLAKTVKGKGVSYMENNKSWHHGIPNQEQFDQAMKEFDEVLT